MIVRLEQKLGICERLSELIFYYYDTRIKSLRKGTKQRVGYAKKIREE